MFSCVGPYRRESIGKLTQKSRHLVISSDISTWILDRPVLFLGKWCLREQDRHIWEVMDMKIADPIGAASQDRFLLHKEARRIEDEIFPRLVIILNEFHAVKRDQRYWKILLGHWLRDIVQLLVNRIVTIERCLKNYEISTVTLNYQPEYVLAATDYGDIWPMSNDNYWNDQIIVKIFERLQVQEIKIEYITSQLGTNKEIIGPNANFKNKINIAPRQAIDKIARRIATVIGRDRDAFVINSYLPPEKELLLNISLCQFPQRRVTLNYKVTTPVDKEIRTKLVQKMQTNTGISMEEIITSFLFELIPVSYLEGYKDLIKVSESAPWPKTPKFIFTSLNFKADEVFKIWTAEKVSRGTPYFVGQHGMGYGNHKFYQSSIEEMTSDKFLTWGWKQELRQHTPAFIFKNSSNSKIRNPERTGLLLIETTPHARFEVWEQADEFEKYMKDQFKFVSNLTTQVKEDLVVRLHPGYAINSGEGDLRWFKFDRNIKLDLGQVPIRQLWITNSLLVHSYDSTGLLETLEADRPTMAFWQDGLDHLVDEAIPYYKQLISAGIVHLTPESAAAKINEVWGDVDKWWMSHEVRKAREVFCHEYARTSKKPIRDLKKLLLKDL